jgi:hypothetical protein
MRIAVLIMLALTSLIQLNAQNDTLKIPFAAYWEKGDTFQFRITNIVQTWQGKKLARNDSSQYLAKFEVIDADTGSYTIRWSFRNTLFNSFRIAEASREKFLKYEMLEVIYKTDEFGAFRGIENWQEISKMMTDFINDVVSTMEMDTSVDKSELRKAMEPLITYYGSKRGVEELAIKELQLIHFPFGNEYSRYKFYNYTMQLPNPLGGAPVKGNGMLVIRNVDAEKKRCLLEQRMMLHPDTTSRLLRKYFLSIGMKKEAIHQSVNESVISIIDNNTFDYFYYPGIPVKISIQRESVISVLEDKMRRSDRTIIERVE